MGQEGLACPLTKGEKILVAMDGSGPSEKALDQAISMARMCNSELFAISVIDLYPEQLAVAPALEQKLSKEVKTILDRAREKVEKENLTVETIVRIAGQPHSAIIQEAKAKDIDMIVLGNRGKSGIKSMLVGSVAQKVLGNAPCAVLVTPA